MTITVPLVAPVITAVEDDGLSPKISGTCWPGATLKLKYSDSTNEHSPNGANGTWTFKRSTGFSPDKEHTVTVIQTVGGQQSPPASQTFTVRPDRLVITEPRQNEETHYDKVVRGTDGYLGATVQLRDAQFDRPLGAPKLLTAHGAWFIELQKLEFRKYQIDATQTIFGRQSAPSDLLDFFVVLVPPVIEVPAQDQSLTRTSTISGTGEAYGQVTIWRENPREVLYPNIPVSREGRWQAQVTWPIGNYTAIARQTFESHESRDSPSRTYKVVPAAPFIESPGQGAHIGRSFAVSGFAFPGDTVTVSLTGSWGTVSASAQVLEDRTWSLTLDTDQPGGAVSLVAVSSRDGFESAPSAVRSVVHGTYLPSIDEPLPGSWVANPPSFAGKGRTGVGRVTLWYNPEISLAQDIPVANGTWRGDATLELPSRGCRGLFHQTITDGADASTHSDWVYSKRFEINPKGQETKS